MGRGSAEQGGKPDQESTVKTLAQTFSAPWVSRLDDEVLAMDASSACGVDCAQVIEAASAAIEADPGIRGTEAEEQVICAAIQQCETFYFG